MVKVLFDHKDTITTSRGGNERSVAVIVITAVTRRQKADICGTASCTSTVEEQADASFREAT